MSTTCSFLFGTVGSPLSTPKSPGGTIGAIQQISVLGLKALELGWVHSVRVSEKTCFEIKHKSEELGIKLSVHAPYYINLNADENEWPNSRKRLMDAAVMGNMAGATDIVFHPGTYFGKPAGEVLPIVICRLRDLVSELQSKNIPVCLRPETMGKQGLLGSLDEILQISREVDQVEPCIDFAHLHARPGDGSLNNYNSWNEILTKYSHSLGNNSIKRMHIHLSGINYTDKGEKNHLEFSKSDLDVKSIFHALKNHQCSGRILCESPILETDAVYLKTLWCENE